VDEAEWQACTDPQKMLRALRRGAGLRKVRLFGAACLRRVWGRLTDERCRQAVEVAERYADGQATGDELAAAGAQARRALLELRLAALGVFYAGRADRLAVLGEATEAARLASALPEAAVALTAPGYAFSPGEVASLAARGLAWGAGGPASGAGALPGVVAEGAAQCALLRDLFGDRGHAVPVNPAVLAWNDGTVVRLARAMYEAGDFRNMGLLADALLDAGCADEELLAHCRNGGGHVRGCFAVDAILGKS
jgi:hypothetical protein